jgi:osmotically-inducible protein OsmY
MKTETQLKQDVAAGLRPDPSIDAKGIELEVEDGFLTLAGDVDSRGAQCYAERAAQRASGVVTEDIVATPQRRARSGAQSVPMVVRSADVPLAGRVNSWTGRSQGRQSAWERLGPRNVVDDLTVAS